MGSLIIILDFLHNSKSGQVRFYIDCSFSKIVYFNPIALSRLNSPIIISFGFGTEYAISESLSLSGFFKVKYNSASSTYKWENIYMGLVTERGDEDVENKTIRFKTGIGLNFFF